MSFSAGAILLIPVAFTDGSGTKKRPAVVVHDFGDADLLIAPVTSQSARSLRDVVIVNWQQAGLRLPSVARMEKLATVGKSTVIKSLGQLAANDWQKAKSILKEVFDEILTG